jgi:hypothetical protein
VALAILSPAFQRLKQRTPPAAKTASATRGLPIGEK